MIVAASAAAPGTYGTITFPVSTTSNWGAFMEYRVVPFVASIAMNDGAGAAASQLQAMIAQQASEGWEYVRLENVETHIAGNSGCFGLGATPDRTVSVSMIVFRK